MKGAVGVTVREAVAAAAGVSVGEVGEPTYVARQGDVDWSVWPVADGRWAATDDAEVAVDRVEVVGSRREAIATLREECESYSPEDPCAPTWTGPEPEVTILVEVDEECPDEEWWEAARADDEAPADVAPLLAVGGLPASVEVEEVTAGEIRSWARGLPGWDGHPGFGHPLSFRRLVEGRRV